MKKFFIITFLILLTFFVSAVILNKENLTTQQNKNPNSNTENVAEDTDNTQEYVYIPIPEDKKAQYKAEVEAYIDENVPIAQQNINKIFVEKDKKIDPLLDINTIHLSLYIELTDITNKYVKIERYKPQTDYIGDWYDFIFPYLKDNKINNKNKLENLYHTISDIEKILYKDIMEYNKNTENLNKIETSVPEKNKNLKLFNTDSCEKNIEKISGQEFWCYTTPSCYNINTFKYNKDSDTYEVDYMFEYNLSGDYDTPKSPHDNGYITHLIFKTEFSPSKKYFNAKYKGFISSTIKKNNKNGEYYNKLLNIYYDSNPKFIPNLNWYIKDFEEMSKRTENYYPVEYLIEVTKCIPSQLKI